MMGNGVSPGTFDFGLSTQEEERAARLHRDSIIIDLVSQGAGGNIFAQYSADLQAQFDIRVANAGGEFDAFAEAFFWPYELCKRGQSDLVREWLVGSGLTCGTYDIPVYDGSHAFLRKWETLTEQFMRLPWLRSVTTAAEIRAAKRDGVVAQYGFWQPFVAAPRDLSALNAAYEKGLRSFMLTFNTMDFIGVGCTERVDAGLSMFGVEVVERCNELGVIVDVSHCGPMTTMDACRHSKRPVNANHTAARGVYAHSRAKTDEALRAIADTGGVIGVVTLPFFLSGDARPTIDHMLDHIDYVADLIGWRHVAIGTDWPLQAPDSVLRATLGEQTKTIGFRDRDNIDVVQRLVGFDDCRDLPNITRGLVKRGYNDEQVKGILGENALRVFSEVCG